MPVTLIPRDPSKPKIVDVIAVLEMLITSQAVRAGDGPYIWAERQLNGSIKMSGAMAAELHKLAVVYRHYYNIMSVSPLERPGLDMKEWDRARKEAIELCKQAELIYPGK
jgi:hypothetical protein